MKKIKLSKGKSSLVDDTDFEHLNQYKWHLHSAGYATRKIWDPNRRKNVSIYMHRQILNTPKGMFTDHINMDKLDNRRSNLRICEHHENSHNMPSSRPNTSGYRGVYKGSNWRAWTAFINFEGKRIYIRGFDTAEEAAHTYNVFAKELYGNHAYQNPL